MSDRPRIVPNPNKPLISSQPMATSFNGPPTNIQGLPGISYDLAWTGTPTGTFQVQVSDSYFPDSEGNPNTGGNWNTIPSSLFSTPYPTPAGSPDHGFLDVNITEAVWIRLQYTATSGSGNLTVFSGAKVL